MSKHHPDDYLRILNDVTQTGLAEVTLVSEVRIADKKAKNGFRILVHRLHTRYPGHEAVAGRYVRANRFALTLGLVSITQQVYHGGAIWPRIDDWLARHKQRGLSAQEQGLFRTVFMDTLREYELPIFAIGDVNNLRDNAALHAGVPDYCLDDWFNLTRRGRERVGDDPSELSRWAQVSVDAAILNDIDQPIKRMLGIYPELAADLFGRAAELADHLREHYQRDDLLQLAKTSPDDLTTSGHPALERLTAIGLTPRWLPAGARNVANNWESSSPRRDGSIGRPRQLRPTIVLRRESQEVALVLPTIPGIQSPVTWLVRVGEHVMTRQAQALDMGDHFATERATVPIHKATSSVAVEVGDQVLRIGLWREGAPALIFDRSGELLSATDTIPPGTCWLLRPEDASVTSEGTALEASAEDDTPTGWRGWVLEQHDVAPHSTLHLKRPDSAFTFRVQGRQRPQLLQPDPVPGVTYFDDPVLPRLPTLRIPPSSGQWQISVTPYRREEPIWVATMSEAGDHELMSTVRDPLGTYTVTARGPLGRTLQESFTVAPGLGVTFSPPTRKIGSDGQLAGTLVRVAAAVGITVSPSEQWLAEGTAFVTLATAEGRRMRPAITAPATRIGLPQDDGTVAWRTRPAQIDPSALEGGFLLSLMDPTGGAAELVATTATAFLQRVSGQRRRSVSTYQLSQLRDTVDVYGIVRLHLSDGQPIAIIKPKPSFRGISVEPSTGAVSLQNLTGSSGDLEAWGWLTGARWRDPTALVVLSDGVLALPDSLIDSGHLLVHVRRADPWVPLDPPADDVSMTLVPIAGEPRYSPPEERVLRVARGDDPGPVGLDDLDLTLAILAKGGQALDAASTGRLRAALSIHPAPLLHGLLDRARDSSDLVPQLITFGLHRCALTDPETRLWERAPELAAGVNARGLTGGAGACQDRLTEMAAREVGDSYLECMQVARDPLASQGRFTAWLVALDAQPIEWVEETMGRLGVVPKALLDADSRIQRSVDIVLDRKPVRAGELVNLSQWTQLLAHELDVSARPDLGVDLRSIEPQGMPTRRHWIPAFVRAVALTSRMQAHGRLPGFVPSPAHDRALATIGRRFSTLVLAELARAEALVVATLADPTSKVSPEGSQHEEVLTS